MSYFHIINSRKKFVLAPVKSDFFSFINFNCTSLKGRCMCIFVKKRGKVYKTVTWVTLVTLKGDSLLLRLV